MRGAATRLRLVALVVVAVVALGACGGTPATAGPTPVPTIAAALDPSATPAAASPSALATPAPTTGPAATPAPTPAPTPTRTAAPTPAPTPGPTLAAGKKGRVEVPEAGVALRLPKGWISLGVTADELAGWTGEAMGDAYPEGLADLAAGMIASGAKLIALDTSRKGLGSSVNVIALDMPALGLPLEDVVRLGFTQVPGVSNLKIKTVDIDGTEAVRADLKLEQTVNGVPFTFRVTAVYLGLERTTSVTVSIIDGGDLDDRDAIVKSIEVLR